MTHTRPKTCVFITGTNAVGKSALAWAIIDRYGGVDRIANDKGSSCTSRLAEVVEEGLSHADTIICEGSYMSTLGLNLTNAMFKADRHLVVSLYADKWTIWERLTHRSNGRNGSRNFKLILNKQRLSMLSARKWRAIGVSVLQFDTAKVSLDEELNQVLSKIEQLCTM